MPAPKRATLRDIATATGLSTVSVHKALYGKSGVSDETRTLVHQVAKRLNYSANEAASALKRTPRSIAVVLPAEIDSENYFYRDMWRAVRDCAAELADFNVTILECSCDGTWHGQAEALHLIKQAGKAEGVVVANSMDQTALNGAIDMLTQANVPVITVNSDALGAQRLCCISAPNRRAGRLAAEFMASGMPNEPCSVVVCGARESSAIHRDNVEGFIEELAITRPLARIVDLRGVLSGGLTTPQALLQGNINCAINAQNSNLPLTDLSTKTLSEALLATDLYGAYSPSARGTMQLCSVASSLSLTNKFIVGSDAFKELSPYFENGILRATVWKDPYGQMSRAIHAMYEHLAGRTATSNEVRIGLVLRNNLIDYL